ncbi:HEPN domain-containing protein [Thermanaeromonas sp. C210]|uniref:HEPN domain-containing protein n=1 Tax=Thermanaeromonas sp. C210 TaxID=2731925 RepID=UPI00155C622B|nr:HEPN domain-containing protein [Thermanaeromonas sp. C210]GFN23694.1 DNA-binding protein [Thermanaeromonas sp. C210]
MRRAPAEEARRWLDQAREDLKWARRLAEEGGYHIACFLSQQVAEKALKAFLYAQGETLVLGHSVSTLGEKAAHYEKKIAEKTGVWSILDGYYIPTRYPNGLPDGIPARVYNQKTAREAVALAAQVVDTVAELTGL